MKKHFFAVLLGIPAVVSWADTLSSVEVPPQPELQFRPAEPESSAEKGLPAPQLTGKEKETRVLRVDEGVLLSEPVLLQRAMDSALLSGNIDAIRHLLPVYTKWQEHDAGKARYARALLAQAEGKADEAVGIYREIIAEHPEAVPIRLQLARALLEDQQNEAAADQFARLASEDLPDDVRRQVEEYREMLRKRDSVRFSVSLNVSRESNINQAPAVSEYGGYLDEAQCALERQRDPGDDCFRGWRFDKPIDATAINYQLSADKKWSLSQGFYLKAGADGYGKFYPQKGRYNDQNLRISLGIGHANQRSEKVVTPFHERRIYGHDAYSYTNGVRLNGHYWLSPRAQWLGAAEYGRQYNMRYANSDIDSRLLSTSMVFYPHARQYWLVGADYYQERNKNASIDNFNRYGMRAEWMQEWRNGFSSRLQLAYAQRHYETEGLFFNQGERRRDEETQAAVSLWHRAVHFYGVTPRITVSHYRNDSNNLLHDYGKTRLFVEWNKTF